MIARVANSAGATRTRYFVIRGFPMEAIDATAAIDSKYAGMSLGELAQKITEVQTEITALENRQTGSFQEAGSKAQEKMEAINRLIGELSVELKGLPTSDEFRDRIVLDDGLSPKQRAELVQLFMRRGELERQIADLEWQRANHERRRGGLDMRIAQLERQVANLERQRVELFSQRSEFKYRFHEMFTKLDPLMEQLRLFDISS